MDRGCKAALRGWLFDFLLAARGDEGSEAQTPGFLRAADIDTYMEKVFPHASPLIIMCDDVLFVGLRPQNSFRLVQQTSASLDPCITKRWVR